VLIPYQSPSYLLVLIALTLLSIGIYSKIPNNRMVKFYESKKEEKENYRKMEIKKLRALRRFIEATVNYVGQDVKQSRQKGYKVSQIS
jgi:hypothetical protein